MQGFSIEKRPEVCVLLAHTIAEDAALTQAFNRFRAFGDKLTNPAITVPFAALAKLNTAEARQRFGKERFAFVSYAENKEGALLDKLEREGKLATGNESPMTLIIEAVRSGSLSLEPTPDSGSILGDRRCKIGACCFQI